MYLYCAYCEVVYCEIRLLRNIFLIPQSHFTLILRIKKMQPENNFT